MTVRVTMQHARAASLSGVGVLCASGIRTWCDRYGIDLRQFVREGLPIEQFERLDDAFARRMVMLAREDAARG